MRLQRVASKIASIEEKIKKKLLGMTARKYKVPRDKIIAFSVKSRYTNFQDWSTDTLNLGGIVDTGNPYFLIFVGTYDPWRSRNRLRLADWTPDRRRLSQALEKIPGFQPLKDDLAAQLLQKFPEWFQQEEIDWRPTETIPEDWY